MNDSGPDDASAYRRARTGAVAAAGVAFVFIYAASLDDDDARDAPGLAVAPTELPASLRSDPKSPMLQAGQTSAPAPEVDGRDEARPGEVEVCGLGGVPADAAVELDDAHAAQAVAALTRVATSLRNDGDERRQVTGLLLQSAVDVAAAAAVDLRASVRRCGGDPGCLEDAGQSRFGTMARAAEAGAEEIARRATASSDPFIYAVALQACGQIGVTPVAAPSCRLLSVEQWARIDPGNATPWLHVAAAARARKDIAALDEAMYRVSTATGSRVYGNAIYGFAAEQVAGGAGDFERSQVAAFVAGVVAAWRLPAYQTVTQYCAAPAMQDSNRWQACDAAARNLVERPSTLLERRIGLRIGERARWPAEKMAALREEDDAMSAVQAKVFSDPEPLGCRAVAQQSGFWLQTSRLGEVGATRALMAASGKSVATLAAQTRADRAALALAATAEAAARPASAASGA